MDASLNRPLLFTAVLILLIGILWTPQAFGQDSRLSFIQRQRQIQDELRIETAATPQPGDQPFTFDWGGWFTSSYELFHDNGIISGGSILAGVHERHLDQHDLRLWGRVNFQDYAEVYARIRLTYVHWERGDSLDAEDHFWDGPNLDRGWAYFDLQKALRYHQGQTIPWTIDARIGRQYVEWGTGLVLSLPVDALVLGAKFDDWEVRGIAATTIRSTDNIDRSPPVAGRLKRDFYGTEITYKGLGRHRPFAYALRSIDRTNTPAGSAQTYGYDSWYFGIGSQGTLGTPKLTYAGEFVWQTGSGYSDVTTGPGPNRLEDIDAFAVDAQLNYYLGDRNKTKFSAEYIFASGDNDRTTPSDTISGNVKLTDDNSFNAFGFRYTGYSFAPIVANIHIFRLGFAFHPAPESQAFKQLELGADAFAYLRAQDGGVSDSSAGMGTTELGYEADVHAFWRVTSDLALVLRYGVFMPGDAFLDGTSRHSLFTGVTLSF